MFPVTHQSGARGSDGRYLILEFDDGDLVIDGGSVLPDPRDVANYKLVDKPPREEDELAEASMGIGP